MQLPDALREDVVGGCGGPRSMRFPGWMLATPVHYHLQLSLEEALLLDARASAGNGAGGVAGRFHGQVRIEFVVGGHSGAPAGRGSGVHELELNCRGLNIRSASVCQQRVCSFLRGGGGGGGGCGDGDGGGGGIKPVQANFETRPDQETLMIHFGRLYYIYI